MEIFCLNCILEIYIAWISSFLKSHRFLFSNSKDLVLSFLRNVWYCLNTLHYMSSYKARPSFEVIWKGFELKGTLVLIQRNYTIVNSIELKLIN